MLNLVVKKTSKLPTGLQFLLRLILTVRGFVRRSHFSNIFECYAAYCCKMTFDLSNKSLQVIRQINPERTVALSGVRHWTHPCVSVEALQNVPAPVSVFSFLSESVQVEQTLHCLWSQEIVSVCRLREKRHANTQGLSEIAPYCLYSALLLSNRVPFKNQQFTLTVKWMQIYIFLCFD